MSSTGAPISVKIFFEKNNYSISVACYEESESEKKHILIMFAK